MMMRKCIKQHHEYEFLKAAKSRVIRAKNVLTCQLALRVYVLTHQLTLRAYVLTCQRVLCAYMLMCQCALRAYVSSATQIHKREFPTVT